MKIVSLKDRFAQNPKSKKTALLAFSVRPSVVNPAESCPGSKEATESGIAKTALSPAPACKVRIVPKKTARKKVQSILSPSREVQQQHPLELPVELSRQGGAMLDWVGGKLHFYRTRVRSLAMLVSNSLTH